MSKTYDEQDMPKVADAFDELTEMVMDEGEDPEFALGVNTAKYELSYNDAQRIYCWLQDEIATEAGDAEAQVRLDEDH